MQALKLKYKAGENGEHGRLEILDPAGNPVSLGLVQDIKFEISAADMLPRLTLSMICSEIEIETPMLVHDLDGKSYVLGPDKPKLTGERCAEPLPPGITIRELPPVGETRDIFNRRSRTV